MSKVIVVGAAIAFIIAISTFVSYAAENCSNPGTQQSEQCDGGGNRHSSKGQGTPVPNNRN